MTNRAWDRTRHCTGSANDLGVVHPDLVEHGAFGPQHRREDLCVGKKIPGTGNWLMGKPRHLELASQQIAKIQSWGSQSSEEGYLDQQLIIRRIIPKDCQWSMLRSQGEAQGTHKQNVEWIMATTDEVTSKGQVSLSPSRFPYRPPRQKCGTRRLNNVLNPSSTFDDGEALDMLFVLCIDQILRCFNHIVLSNCIILFFCLIGCIILSYYVVLIKCCIVLFDLCRLTINPKKQLCTPWRTHIWNAWFAIPVLFIVLIFWFILVLASRELRILQPPRCSWVPLGFQPLRLRHITIEEQRKYSPAVSNL